jgi:hypothetical protein
MIKIINEKRTQIIYNQLGKIIIEIGRKKLLGMANT